MAKRPTPGLIKGHATHRRTEGDYMAVLLDTVTLEDWRGVVAGALQEAKGGDPQARNWLAQYLIGRPEGKAPTPLTVVVNQLNGADAVVNKLASPIIHRNEFPSLVDRNADYGEHIRAAIAAELADKVQQVESAPNPATARAGGVNGADSEG